MPAMAWPTVRASTSAQFETGATRRPPKTASALVMHAGKHQKPASTCPTLYALKESAQAQPYRKPLNPFRKFSPTICERPVALGFSLQSSFSSTANKTTPRNHGSHTAAFFIPLIPRDL